MSDRNSSFLENDEFGWLNAYLREPSAIPAPSDPIPIPVKSLPSPTLSSIPINDSLTLLREKGVGGRRRYQTSTKSSHAKSVQNSKNVVEVGLPASLRSTTAASPTRRVRTASLRNALRSNKSPLARVPSSSQQEWIYRRPKSPVSPKPSPNTVSSPTRPAARTRPANDKSVSQQSSHWANVLRTRSRVERAPKGVTLAQLKVDSSVTQSKKLSNCSSPTSTSSSSSTISSRPQTPTSPRAHSTSPLSLRFDGKKPHRRYRDVSFDSTSSVSTLTSRLPGSLADSPIEPKNNPPAATSCLHTPRKNSVGTTSTTGSSKSVKFVELPTVHYASYWDLDQQKVDEVDDTMGIDLDSMDMEPSPQSSRTDATDVDIFAVDGPPWMHPEVDDMPESPTKEQYRPSISAPERTSPIKRFPSFRRANQGSRSSISVPVKGRPTISGPMALGSRPVVSSPMARSSKSVISIRNAPSVESFRSAKSGGAKSIRSLASLKSLPSSLKSTVTLSARGFRDWFKERLDIGVVG